LSTLVEGAKAVPEKVPGFSWGKGNGAVIHVLAAPVATHRVFANKH
jgi:hypothetical protein